MRFMFKSWTNYLLPMCFKQILCFSDFEFFVYQTSTVIVLTSHCAGRVNWVCAGCCNRTLQTWQFISEAPKMAKSELKFPADSRSTEVPPPASQRPPFPWVLMEQRGSPGFLLQGHCSYSCGLHLPYLIVPQSLCLQMLWRSGLYFDKWTLEHKTQSTTKT